MLFGGSRLEDSGTDVGREKQPYCDALHVQLFEVEHTAQDGLLVPCLQGYGIPIQGELTQGMQLFKAGDLIPPGTEGTTEIRPLVETLSRKIDADEWTAAG